MHLGRTYATNRVLTACLDRIAMCVLSSSGYLAHTATKHPLLAEAPSTKVASTRRRVPRGSSRPRAARGRVGARLSRADACSSSDRNHGRETSDRYHSAVIVFARDFGMSPVS